MSVASWVATSSWASLYSFVCVRCVHTTTDDVQWTAEDLQDRIAQYSDKPVMKSTFGHVQESQEARRCAGVTRAADGDLLQEEKRSCRCYGDCSGGASLT